MQIENDEIPKSHNFNFLFSLKLKQVPFASLKKKNILHIRWIFKDTVDDQNKIWDKYLCSFSIVIEDLF